MFVYENDELYFFNLYLAFWILISYKVNNKKNVSILSSFYYYE